MKDIDNPSSMLVIAESGASFTSVNKLAESPVTSVIMQLGTNDVSKHGGDREELMVNASNAIQSIEELFPNATVGVFSIPPRRGKGNAVSNNNNAANKTNMFVKKYCAKKVSRLYVDTWTTLTSNGGQPVKRLFSATDKSGVHYSTLAKGEVISCMTASLLNYFETNPPSTVGKRKAGDSPLSDDRNSKEQCMSNTPPSVNEGNAMLCQQSTPSNVFMSEDNTRTPINQTHSGSPSNSASPVPGNQTLGHSRADGRKKQKNKKDTF